MSSASLRLMGALNITKTIINECKAKGYPPVAVSILSCAGNPVTTVLMDGCSPVIFPQMAESKARVAVGFKVSSRDFGDKVRVGVWVERRCKGGLFVHRGT
jgi:uncharacterized protein GlcG (DUF336 family)